MSTCTWTKRSPRPRPRSLGTPSPLRVMTVPLWVPAAMARSRVSSRVSKGTLPPRAASATGTCTVAWRSTPDRSKTSSGSTARWTNRAPFGPPRNPAGPWPARRRVEPSSTPAGMSTVSVRVSVRRPSPAAVGARGLDRLAGALAALAGDRGDHLSEDRLAHPAQLAGPLALGAADHRGAGLGPGPLARVAVDRGGHLDLALDPEDRLAEGELDDHLGVGPRHRTGAPAAPRLGAAHAVEEGVEQVAQAAGTERVARPGRRHPDRTPRPGRSGRSGPGARGRFRTS